MSEKDRRRSYSWTDPALRRGRRRELSGRAFLEAERDGLLPPAPACATVGWSIREIGEGRVTLSLKPAEYLMQSRSVLHGGIIATLLDSAMVAAANTTLPAGRAVTTVELKVNFVRPAAAEAGEFLTEGVLIHAGRQLVTAEGRVTDPTGKLYAHATCTLMIQER